MLKGVGTQSTPIHENSVLSSQPLCNPKMSSSQNLKKKNERAKAGLYFIMNARKKSLQMNYFRKSARVQGKLFPAVLAVGPGAAGFSRRWRPLVEPLSTAPSLQDNGGRGSIQIALKQDTKTEGRGSSGSSHPRIVHQTEATPRSWHLSLTLGGPT